MPVLETKLFKPKVNSSILERKRLITLLEKNRGKHATFVVAPTGYGKSVLISQWIENTSKQYSWISIDEELNNVNGFLTYLLYDLSRKLPAVFELYNGNLTEVDLPPLKVVLAYIINSLTKVKGEFYLVFDDCHLISDQKVYDIIYSLIDCRNPQIHVVLISRKEPSFKLSKLRSFDLIHELGADNIKFNQQELLEIAANNSNTDIIKDHAERILDYTEGWVVGIRLVLQYLDKKDAKQLSESKIILEKPYFKEYLLEETFALVSKPVQKLLLVSTISSTFSLDLLQAIVEDAKQDFPGTTLNDAFNELITSSQFIISLDEKGKWYRFHHYFNDFLSDLLEKSKSKKEIQQMHKKAAVYFEQIKNYDKAIGHGVKSNDRKYVVSLFQNYKHSLLNQDQFTRLTKWIDLIPKDWQVAEPEILLLRTYLYDNSGDYAAMHKDIELLQSILPSQESTEDEHHRWWGEFYASLTILMFLTGQVEASIAASEKALKFLPEEGSYMWDVAFFYKYFSLQTIGQQDRVDMEYKNTLSSIPLSATDKHIRLSASKAMLNAVAGDLDGTISDAKTSIRLLNGSKLFVSSIYANYLYHTACYFKNDLSEANIADPNINKHIYMGRPFWGINFFFTKGLALHALGEQEALKTVLNQLYEFADNYAELPLFSLVKTFEMELCLMQQDVTKAKELSYEANFEPYPPICFGFFPQLTQVKFWIALATKSKLHKAHEKLVELIAFGRATNRYNLLLEALPLQAITFHLSGDKESCIKAYTEALDLSESREYIRNFIDLGYTMQTLTEECIYNKLQHPYLDIIYQAFLKENIQRRYEGQSITKDNFINANTGKVNITLREVHLLRMLMNDLQNKEIAQELGITTESVKKALYRLYKKLDVSNRSSAIYKSIQVGLLKIEKEEKNI